ncbi:MULTISPECIES: riboflavin synthase [Curtobacterium]|uniref:Riboflavin synthase n=1 Tax=Curtobacterium poinsettiae TaxID=159612 RepID=A0ABT3S3Y2_9MICO|nr:MULTISPECIES: riboflavin synthase [Curtobacterium]EYT64995.1 riboflavin synthase subunit alpha [Curtobacterium flaccumfaciens UCD-AKU]MBT1609584.1 riboflavin synthase [Curtobacterium flaccumfaciens pv. poinsettiae]MCX2849527.1 riboflavin synthase [Curtobacterium flaccumfaciens pv. poinsettiae]UXN18085.1 riboflavin synthase [Curtobacterium flaccumfaciens pv. poinsettiae]VXB11522.1 Riboflavin synthase [Curtobacterium sp. 8I-2]
MFTGIIEELGTVTAVEQQGDSVALTVHGPVVVQDARHGDSIATSGVCLTVVEQTPETFTAFVMKQTLDMSAHGTLRVGDRLNLERAASVGDRLGGHIVQGHIDGTAAVLETSDGDGWRRVRFSLAPALSPLVVDKGSVALDGVSLTVSAVSPEDTHPDAAWFEVSLIPETLEATTLGLRVPGDRVNVETDVLARHVRRMLRLDAAAQSLETAAQPLETTGSEAR